MILKKKIAFSLLGLTTLVPLFTFLTNPKMTTINLSDNFFMIALPFLMIGTFISVLSSGFFDFFQKNMKHVTHLRKKNRPKEFIPLSEIFEKQPIYWFVVGGILLLFSITLAILS